MMRKLLVSLFLLAAQAAFSAETNLKLYLAHNTSDADIAAAQSLQNSLAEPPGLGLSITVESGPEFCPSEYACLQALPSGEADIVVTGIGAATRMFSSLQGIDLQYLQNDATSPETFENVLRRSLGDTENVYLLAITAGSPLYVMANSSRRIVEPDDIAGLRLSAPSRRMSRKIQLLRGEYVDLSGTSLPTALQIGAIDGAVLDISNIMKDGLPMAGMRYATYDGYGHDLRFWWVRKNMQTTDYWPALEEAASKMHIAARQASIKRNAQAIIDFQAAGGDYYILDPQEQAVFRERALIQYLDTSPPDDRMKELLRVLGIDQ